MADIELRNSKSSIKNIKQENPYDVLGDANYIKCLFESSEERERQIEANFSSWSSFGPITKFNQSRLDKIIKHKSFIVESRNFFIETDFSLDKSTPTT